MLASMTDERITRAQALLREGHLVEQVAATLQVSTSWLRAAFVAAGLPPPKSWQVQAIGPTPPQGRVISFRLGPEECRRLDAMARTAAVTPARMAQTIVQAAVAGGEEEK